MENSNFFEQLGSVKAEPNWDLQNPLSPFQGQGSPVFELRCVSFSSFLLVEGSFVETIDFEGKPQFWRISRFEAYSPSQLEIRALSFQITADPLVFCLDHKGEQRVVLSQIQNVFTLVDLCERSSRIFWPTFVRFFTGIDSCFLHFPSNCSGKEQQLLLFSKKLFSGIAKLLSGDSVGLKPLFSLQPVDLYGPLLQFLSFLPEKKNQVILTGKFEPLHLLLGSSYFWNSEEHHASEGWGFHKEEKKRLNHYVVEIKIALNPTTSELKIFGLQLTQNFYGTFQVVQLKK